MAAITTHDCYTSFRSETQILLVDHNPEMLDSAERILKCFAYKVSVAKSWWEALSLLANETMKFDLVLLDAHSPYINRFNILFQETIRKKIPIILTSSDDIAAEEFVQKGASYYYKKPIALVNIKTLWAHATTAKIVKSNRMGKRAHKINIREKNKTRIYESNIAPSFKKRAMNEGKNKIGTSGFARKRFGQTDIFFENFAAQHAYRLGSNVYTEWSNELQESASVNAHQFSYKVQEKASYIKWSEKFREPFVADSNQRGLEVQEKAPYINWSVKLREPFTVGSNQQGLEVQEKVPCINWSEKLREPFAGDSNQRGLEVQEKAPYINWSEKLREPFAEPFAANSNQLCLEVQEKAPYINWSEKLREPFAADSNQLGVKDSWAFGLDCNPGMSLDMMKYEPNLTQVQVPMSLQGARTYGRMPSLSMPPVNITQPPLVTDQLPPIENSFGDYGDDFFDALFGNNSGSNDDFAAFLQTLEPFSPKLGNNATNVATVEDNNDNIILGVTPNPNEVVNNQVRGTEDIESFPFGVDSFLFHEPRAGNGFAGNGFGNDNV